MFGYVIAHKPELKFREFDEYRSYYCGLCRSLRKHHGFTGQFTLSYDMTFLVMLLSSLYEPELHKTTSKCPIHPFKGCATTNSEYTDYVSDMNIILTYYKCIDDWNDEHKVSSLLFSKLLDRKGHTKYADKIDSICAQLDKLREYELAGVTDIDKVSGTFGNIMSTLFTPHHDQYEASLSRLGFFLGKFIYILDAYDDLDADLKKGCYNPFAQIHTEPDFQQKIISMLQMMMAEVTDVFEMLPVIDNVEIMRNILYAGVWSAKCLKKPQSDCNSDNDIINNPRN